MEITPFTIYLINALTHVGSLCEGAGAVLLALAGGLTIFIVVSFMEDDKLCEKLWKKVKIFAVCGISLLLVCSLIPNKAEICAMFMVPSVMNNVEIKGLSEDVLKGMRSAAREWALSFVEKVDKKGK